MWLFDSILRSIVCLSCFCLKILQLSNSVEFNSNNQTTNSGNYSTLKHIWMTETTNISINDSSNINSKEDILLLPTEIVSNWNISSELQHVLPTPLILHLNRSAAQLLIQEANSAFVSNTSLSDLANDNATQQMLIRYRERKRQVRIQTIQRDILKMLGLTQGPNMTARFSAEERQSLVRLFDRTIVEHEDKHDNETVYEDTEEDY